MTATIDRRGYGRTGRLPCGSLRRHDEHEWTGQTTGPTFVCSGVAARELTDEDRALCAEEAAWKRWEDDH